MLNQKFYWGTVRKCIVAFGNLFNNIIIDRKDSDDHPAQSIRVPLAYAAKQKFIARIDQIPGPAETRTVELILPRMSFELVKIEYDSSRKISLVQKNNIKNNSGTTLTSQFVPTPYNLQVNLYIYVKNTDDGLQIVEQILPYFNPDFNLSLKAVPDLEITHDIPIILNNIEFDDNYEGEFTEQRRIIWTLSFTIKTNFYGPASKTGFIRTAIANIYSNKEMSNLFGTITVTTDPADANPGDDFEFVETFDGFD